MLVGILESVSLTLHADKNYKVVQSTTEAFSGGHRALGRPQTSYVCCNEYLWARSPFHLQMA